jgi:hypothetical protein
MQLKDQDDWLIKEIRSQIKKEIKLSEINKLRSKYARFGQ